MPDLIDEEIVASDFGIYRQEKFFNDMGPITVHRTSPTCASYW